MIKTSLFDKDAERMQSGKDKGRDKNEEIDFYYELYFINIHFSLCLWKHLLSFGSFRKRRRRFWSTSLFVFLFCNRVDNFDILYMHQSLLFKQMFLDWRDI